MQKKNDICKWGMLKFWFLTFEGDFFLGMCWVICLRVNSIQEQKQIESRLCGIQGTTAGADSASVCGIG